MAMITKGNAEGLFTEQDYKEIFSDVQHQSQALALLRRLPNMTTNKGKIAVLDLLPVSYWQGSDTAKKQTSNAAWKNKYLEAAELAVIIPIAESTLEDADYDIWAEVKPLIASAIAKKIDEAIFLGVDKPAGFPDGIVDQALSHGFSFARGADTFYNAVSKGMGKVEEVGVSVNGILGGPSIKKAFREMVDTTGQLIVGDEISALPRHIVENGAWDGTKATFVVGDFKQAVYAVRKDITYKLLTEGVVQDPSDNSIIYNLGQQDMVALRVVFRMSWQLPNPVVALQGNSELKLPFAVCKPSADKVVVTLPDAATFETSIVVSMSANVASAKIYYTNDGTTPTSASTLYEAPITLTATKTIKAIGIATDYTNSDVVSKTYTKS